MDYQKALTLKSEIAATILGKNKRKSRVISFAAGTSAAALNSIATLQNEVNGVGIAAGYDGDALIKIFTRHAPITASATIAAQYGLPQNNILIEKVGNIQFRNATGRYRPPHPGISVAHYKTTAGTLGCFVKDDNNLLYLLSNNHVLAHLNEAAVGDPILQPAPLDGGRKKQDVIAELSDVMPLQFNDGNAMDAAIATVINPLQLNTLINGTTAITGMAAPYKQKVEKYGRTTGHTIGRITTRHLDLQVDFNGELINFEDQFEVKGMIKNGSRMPFCLSGDSGSLIIEYGTGNAIGLLFAGTNDGTTFATPIAKILDAFLIKIL